MIRLLHAGVSWDGVELQKLPYWDCPRNHGLLSLGETRSDYFRGFSLDRLGGFGAQAGYQGGGTVCVQVRAKRLRTLNGVRVHTGRGENYLFTRRTGCSG